jgi:hypothetical protein
MSAMSPNTNLERLIAEARAAERAGVFGRTRLDVSALVGGSSLEADRPVSPRLIRFYERALVGLPLAACVAIVIGIASMHGGPMGEAVSSPVAVLERGGDSSSSVELCSVEFIAGCVAGPGAPVTADCGCADLDRDGDVDLLDLGSYQRLAAGIQ